MRIGCEVVRRKWVSFGSVEEVGGGVRLGGKRAGQC